MWALRSRRGQRQNRQQRGKCSPLNLVVSSHHFYGNCGAKFSKMFGKLLPNNFKPVMEANHEWTRMDANLRTENSPRIRTTADYADAMDKTGSPGRTGCQPVLFGSLPKSFNAHSKSFWFTRVSPASCRRLQAGSLRSPQLRDSPRRDSAVRGVLR
jgi:hypothetical protein